MCGLKGMNNRLIYIIISVILYSLSIKASPVKQVEFISASKAIKKQVKAIVENGDTIAI